MNILYDDGRISCDERGVHIRWYYLWGGTKTIPYDQIQSVEVRTLAPVRGRWRLWGSGDLRRWYNLDPNRPRKDFAIELDLGGHVRPVITPDEPDAVVRLLQARIS
jgi:hypothetical protein